MKRNVVTQRKTWQETNPEPKDLATVIPPSPTGLNLVEEVFLLGLNDKRGHTSFWNNSISSALRGCILIELSFLGRIRLEKGNVRKNLSKRKLFVVDDTLTDDPLLDETLKRIKDVPANETVQTWLELLNGEVWNPLKIKYALTNVRHRLAKNLVEKGILQTSKRDFLLFELITHPLVDVNAKSSLVARLKNSLLTQWTNEAQRMDVRVLALIFMCHFSEVLEDNLESTSDEEYILATNRVADLVDLDVEIESRRSYSTDVFWAVVTSYLK